MLKLRSESITWQVVDDEIVCLDLKASRYLLVNATGAALWPMIIEGADVRDLAHRLVQTFGVDVGTATRDATAFAELLAERDLLERP